MKCCMMIVCVEGDVVVCFEICECIVDVMCCGDLMFCEVDCDVCDEDV